MHAIIPAILPESFDDLRDKLASVRNVALRVQIDVCNGTYAKTKSWPYDGSDRHHFDAIQKEDEGLPFWEEFDFELDLLIKDPERHLEEWVRAGATCLIVHAEATNAMGSVIEYAIASGVSLAVATLPNSPVSLIEPWVPHVAFVQVMGNSVVGEQGRALEESAIEKVRTLHTAFPALTLGVDIGVNEDTLPTLLEAGASRFGVGSAIFGSPEPRRAYRTLADL